MRHILIEFRGDRSQTEMARRYNVTQQTWSQWELGGNTPTPDKMKQLSIDIGRPMEEIFADAFFRGSNKKENTA